MSVRTEATSFLRVQAVPVPLSYSKSISGAANDDETGIVR